MADVVIRGMEFPESCGDCPFQRTRWTGDFCSAGQFMFGIDFDYRDKHPKCPLDHLPEGHGRLVDAREVLEKADKAPWFDGDVSELGLLLGSEVTTIIPAEGGGADGKP